MTSPLIALADELAQAERALEASRRALGTHGYLRSSWEIFKADAVRLKALRAIDGERG